MVIQEYFVKRVKFTSMKKVIMFLLLAVIAVGASAQSKNNEGTYESELSKDVLWSNLKTWVSSNITSYKHSVDMEDKTMGAMVVNFTTEKESFIIAEDIYFCAKIKVEVKDKKWRYKIYDCEFRLSETPLMGCLSSLSSKILDKAKDELEAVKNIENKDIPDSWVTTRMAYKKLLEGTPRYSKPKDEKKGKINPTYTRYNNVLELIDRIQTNYNIMLYKVSDSLQKQMSQKAEDW